MKVTLGLLLLAVIVAIGAQIGHELSSARQVGLAAAVQRERYTRGAFERYASLCAGRGPLAVIEFGRVRIHRHPSSVRLPIAEKLRLPIGRSRGYLVPLQ